MSDVTVYHNPRCSKSRRTLALLEEQGIAPRVVEYLKEPPTAAELKRVIKQLGVSAHDVVRTKEAEYKDAGIGPDSSDDDVIAAIVACPKLLERPIVVVDGKAAIGRPPENVLEIL